MAVGIVLRGHTQYDYTSDGIVRSEASGGLGVDARSTPVNCAFQQYFSPTCQKSPGLPLTMPITTGGSRSSLLASTAFAVSASSGPPSPI